MIRFDHVSFERGSMPVLRHLDFTIEEGERIAIVGPNGAGKTSTLKLCNGLYHPTEGAVYLDGTDTKALRASAIAKTAGFLFQNPDRQIFSDTLEKELAFGLTIQGIEGEPARQRIQELIQEFGLDPGQNPLTASRGMRQRIALASIVATKPRLLLLDEPTTGLDYSARTQMMEAIRRLNRDNGATVVIITHDMALAQDFASRVLVLVDGHLVADDTADAVLRDEALLARASLAPPQMPALLNRLGDLGRFDTMEDLVAYIQRRRSK